MSSVTDRNEYYVAGFSTRSHRLENNPAQQIKLIFIKLTEQ